MAARKERREVVNDSTKSVSSLGTRNSYYKMTQMFRCFSSFRQAPVPLAAGQPLLSFLQHKDLTPDMLVASSPCPNSSRAVVSLSPNPPSRTYIAHRQDPDLAMATELYMQDNVTGICKFHVGLRDTPCKRTHPILQPLQLAHLSLSHPYHSQFPPVVPSLGSE